MDQIKASNATFLDENAGGKGKYFQARILQAGLVKYSFGVCLLEKDAIDRFIYGFVGCPVIIDHKDITNENAKDERVGVISKVWFNEMDGWFWVEGVIFDEEAISLINDGYNVSCQYEISEYANNVGKALHNGNPYDKVILNGKPEHLAIVKNPRYENAMIAVNALDATNKDDDDIEEWITVKGNHIPVRKGQTKEEATKQFIESKEKSSDEGEDYREGQIVGDKLSKDYVKIDRIVEPGKQYAITYPDGTHAILYREEVDDFMHQNIATGIKKKSSDDGATIKSSEELRNLFSKHDALNIKTTGQVKELAKDLEVQTEKGTVITTVDGNTAQEYHKIGDDKWLFTHGKANFNDIYWQKEMSTYDVADELSSSENARGRAFERASIVDKPAFDNNKKSSDGKQSDKDRVKISDLKSRKNEILKEYWEAEEGSSERERLQYDLDAVTDEIIRLEDKAKNAIIQAINEIKETDMFSKLFKKKENKMDKDELKSLFMECLSELTAKNEADEDKKEEKKDDEKLADDKVAENEDEKDDKKDDKKDEEKDAENKCKNEVVDKRDIIRQIMAIAGKEEASEDVKTIAKLAEKLAYDKSEADDKKADNKCKNEDEEKDKEKDEEKKEDDKEAENKKASNAIDELIGKMSFGSERAERATYLTQKKAVELGDKLF